MIPEVWYYPPCSRDILSLTVEVFGGGLFDPMPSTGGNSNISHSVPLDTDSGSGLEVDGLTAAGTNGAAGRRSGPQSP